MNTRNHTGANMGIQIQIGSQEAHHGIRRNLPVKLRKLNFYGIRNASEGGGLDQKSDRAETESSKEQNRSDWENQKFPGTLLPNTNNLRMQGSWVSPRQAHHNQKSADIQSGLVLGFCSHEDITSLDDVPCEHIGDSPYALRLRKMDFFPSPHGGAVKPEPLARSSPKQKLMSLKQARYASTDHSATVLSKSRFFLSFILMEKFFQEHIIKACPVKGYRLLSGGGNANNPKSISRASQFI